MPHCVQYAVPGSAGAAQEGQVAGRGDPQLPQNRAPSGVDEAHEGQLDPIGVILSGSGPC